MPNESAANRSGLSQVDCFNLTAGLIFDALYTDFPMKQGFNQDSLGASFDEIVQTPEQDEWNGSARKRIAGHKYVSFSNIPPKTYIFAVLDWLTEEGFLKREGDTAYKYEYQITLRTLEILGRVPAGLDQNIGSELGQAVAELGKEASRATISELVGMIFGAAAKEMMS